MSIFLRLLLVVLALLPLRLAAETAFSACGSEAERALVEKRLASIQNRLQVANGLFSRAVSAEFSLDKLLGVSIDFEADVNLALSSDRAAMRETGAQLDALRSQSDSGCDASPAGYRTLLGELLTREQEWLVARIRLFELDRETRLRLLRFSRNWQTMGWLDQSVMAVRITSGVNGQSSAPEKAGPIEGEISFSALKMRGAAQAIVSWHESWRQYLQIWLSALLSKETTAYQATEIWKEMLAQAEKLEALPEEAIQALQAEAYRQGVAVPQLDEGTLWMSLIRRGYTELRTEISQWRNQQLWRAGVWPVARSLLANPGTFLQNFAESVFILPDLFLDGLKRPFLRQLRTVSQSPEYSWEAGSLFLLWGGQVLGLGGTAWLLFLFARSLLKTLAHAQNHLLASGLPIWQKRVGNGVLAMLKPNIFWVTIALASYLLMSLISPRWFILQWIGPLGALFAGYMGARVISEWVISHTYARADKYFSPGVADEAVRNSEALAWWVVTFFVMVWGAWETGGGELLLLVIVLICVLAWIGVARIALKFEEAVYPFVRQAGWRLVIGASSSDAGAKEKREKERKEPGRFLKACYPIFYPLSFLFDLLFVMHDKLMIFDLYRKFSAKMLRIRLDTQDVVTEEVAKDFHYRDWLLRSVEEGAPELDVVVTPALEPVQSWLDGQSDDNVLVIIGDQGSGKTELAKQLDGALADTRFQYFGFETKTLTREAFYQCLSSCLEESLIDEKALQEWDLTSEPQVLVLDAVENLFLSEVGCLEGYRTLIAAMNLPLKNLFWVVLIHAPSWNYLKHVFDKEQRFTNLIWMPKWSASQIRKLILSRHQGSTLKVKYDEMLLSAAATSESASIRTADARVFNILWEQSDGNPLQAMHLWLKAATRKGRILEIGLPDKPSMAPLRAVTEEALFVYALLISHHALTAQEIVKVSHFLEPVVRQALKYGITQGMLLVDDDGRYLVHPLWLSNLSLYLRRKNLVW